MLTPERPIYMMKLGDPYIFGIVYSMPWLPKKIFWFPARYVQNKAKLCKTLIRTLFHCTVAVSQFFASKQNYISVVKNIPILNFYICLNVLLLPMCKRYNHISANCIVQIVPYPILMLILCIPEAHHSGNRISYDLSPWVEDSKLFWPNVRF